MVQRSVPATESEAPLQSPPAHTARGAATPRRSDIPWARLHGNGRRRGAPRSVGILRVDAWRRRGTPRPGPASPADRPSSSPGRWPPFNSTAGTPNASSSRGRHPHVGDAGGDGHSRQRFGFRQIRSDDPWPAATTGGAERRLPRRPARDGRLLQPSPDRPPRERWWRSDPAPRRPMPITAESPSIPVLITSAPRSLIATSICRAMKSNGTECTAYPQACSVLSALSAPSRQNHPGR